MPVAVIIVLLLITSAVPVKADWDPGDPAKWAQEPDLTPDGIDIDIVEPGGLADDFECRITGLITDVHFWGSWLGDMNGVITQITLKIWSDIPEDPPGVPYSRPGDLLWERTFVPPEFTERIYYVLETEGEWWWDPREDLAIQNADTMVFQYNIYIDPMDAFLQMGTEAVPVIYWLGIDVQFTGGDFGWKTAATHWNDDAVWWDPTVPGWRELRYPVNHPFAGESIDLSFVITDTYVPVELSSFTATPREGGVRLEWTTQSESENLGFHIYRSDSEQTGYHPITMELIPGAGTSPTVHSYKYLDRSVVDGSTYYYRLVDISTDGIETYHGPLKVAVPSPGAVLSLEIPVPNPVREEAIIRFTIPESGMTRMYLYDLKGRMERVIFKGEMQAGSHVLNFDRMDGQGSRLAAGTYVMRLVSPAGMLNRKIILAD